MSFSETCRRCGQEVRWGTIAGVEGYHHREPVDHVAIFGQATDLEEVERQLDLPRERVIEKTGEVVVYTTRQFDIDRMKKAARDAARADEDEEEGHELEPIEVRSIHMPHKGRLFVGCPDGSVAVAQVPGGVRTVLNLAAKCRWEVDRLAYARGPYGAANGGSLGVSDTVVLLLRGPLDGPPTLGVASWRDGKSDWAWLIENRRKTTRVSVTALKDRMKEDL